MKAYQTSHYAAGKKTYHATLEAAHEATGFGYVVGPEEGPKPGESWEVYESAEAHAAGKPPYARIHAVDVSTN